MTDLDALKRRNPIAQVIGSHGVRLRPHGRRLTGRCPFHNDGRPSLVVYPATQSYFCFGCGAGGDVIDFLRRAEGLDFKQALTRLDGLRPAPAPVSDRPAQRALTARRPRDPGRRLRALPGGARAGPGGARLPRAPRRSRARSPAASGSATRTGRCSPPTSSAGG